MSTATLGFNLNLSDGAHMLTINNTEKSGYVTFKDNTAMSPIHLTERDFVKMVGHLSYQAEGIAERLRRIDYPETTMTFTVTNEDPEELRFQTAGEVNDGDDGKGSGGASGRKSKASGKDKNSRGS